MWLLFLFAATFVGRLQYWHHLQRHHSAHQRLLNFKPSAASWLFFGFKVVLKPVEEAQQLSEKKPRKEASELLIARLLTRMSTYNGPKYWVVTINLLLSHSFTCCICVLSSCRSCCTCEQILWWELRKSLLMSWKNFPSPVQKQKLQ